MVDSRGGGAQIDIGLFDPSNPATQLNSPKMFNRFKLSGNNVIPISYVSRSLMMNPFILCSLLA